MESVMITLCEKCGYPIQIGEHPFCPHGFGSGSIAKDGIPGGVTLENYGPTPVTFYSHSERRRYMQAKGLQEIEKFCPMPGTDIDPQGIPNPKGYMDAYTLKNGAELLCRQSGPTEKEWDGIEAGVLRDVQVGHITERDAQAIADGDKARQSRFHRRTR